ncbi:hypothetical protein ACF068_31150 [Streptomyces sp. NPDC016309]|uniref:hypothetical protein n=1 Tax=Streptomyces sp. NPDC016309 TaxID=3364965 RepID=UPI0036FBD657
MPWNSANTAAHTGAAKPQFRPGAPLAWHDPRPWTYFDGEQAPAAPALRAICSCGWVGPTVHVIDRTRTVEQNEKALRDEWSRHASEAALEPANGVLTELIAMLNRLTVDDPRAALTMAGVLERASRDLQAAAAESARAAGDSWIVVGAALGVSKQAAHERFGKPGGKARMRPGPTPEA